MENNLFTLLRIGLGLTLPETEDLDSLRELKEEDWVALMDLAQKHGVSAFVFDAFQILYGRGGNIPVSMDLLMDWLGQTSYAEEINRRQIDIMNQFGNYMSQNGCDVMVMKGQANGLYYPNPLHRATGDIDIYMFQNYEKGNELASRLGAKVDTHWYKHSQIHYNGEMFENHQYFVHTRDGERGRTLDSTLKSLLNAQDLSSYPDSKVLLPSLSFTAFFLTYHGMGHFLSEGLHLKQVLDWVMFVNKEKDNIDWQQLYKLTSIFNRKRFLDVMNDIAVHKFGISIDNPEVATTSPYTDKVLHSILYDEDFVFSSGKSGWQNRWHLITNMWKYRWKYNDIYETSIFKQFYYYASGYLFHTEK